MASTRIIYPVTTPWGAQVSEFASLYLQTLALAVRMKAAFDSMTTNGAGPFTEMETELGLTAGQGTLLYGVVADGTSTLLSWGEIHEIDLGQ